jgi:hypothetical protein
MDCDILCRAPWWMPLARDVENLENGKSSFHWAANTIWLSPREKIAHLIT